MRCWLGCARSLDSVLGCDVFTWAGVSFHCSSQKNEQSWWRKKNHRSVIKLVVDLSMESKCFMNKLKTFPQIYRFQSKKKKKTTQILFSSPFSQANFSFLANRENFFLELNRSIRGPWCKQVFIYMRCLLSLSVLLVLFTIKRSFEMLV